MTTKQTGTVVMTTQQLDTVVGGALVQRSIGRFQLVGGTMCSAKSAQTKRSKRFELEHGQGFQLHNNGA